MAPAKSMSTSNRLITKDAATALNTLIPTTRKGPTRGKNGQNQNTEVIQTRAKRKADHSSPIKNDKIKRSALGNLTNNANKLTTQPTDEDAKGKENHGKKTQSIKLEASKKIATRAVTKMSKVKNTTKIDAPQMLKPLLPPPAPLPASNAVGNFQTKTLHKSRRISNEFNQTEDSLYMSALEDVSSCESMRLSGNFEAAKRRSMLLQQQQQKATDQTKTEDGGNQVIKAEDDERFKDILSPMTVPLPKDVDDYDKINLDDPFQVSHYAMDIFNYLKWRENQFIIDDYMPRQVHLSKYMRSLLVDWMVEVQETFELNHETLYLAVKVVDLFLCKVIINKERLQLLGAAALFIACKFDERTPPLVDDFLYVCDGAYKHNELIKMEMTVLRTIDYDLGIPLSYRFLRRYARCAKINMPTLTLARYILELSLMDYDTIGLSDSRLASAALFIALRMQGGQTVWTSTLEHYTGYKLNDFADIVPVLNAGLHRKQKGTIKNIKNKYSHKIFHEVAKIELMSTEELFAHNVGEKFNQQIQSQLSEDIPILG